MMPYFLRKAPKINKQVIKYSLIGVKCCPTFTGSTKNLQISSYVFYCLLLMAMTGLLLPQAPILISKF